MIKYSLEGVIASIRLTMLRGGSQTIWTTEGLSSKEINKRLKDLNDFLGAICCG